MKKNITVFTFDNKSSTFPQQNVEDFFADLESPYSYLSKQMEDEEGNLVQINWRKVSHVTIQVWGKKIEDKVK